MCLKECNIWLVSCVLIVFPIVSSVLFCLLEPISLLPSSSSCISDILNYLNLFLRIKKGGSGSLGRRSLPVLLSDAGLVPNWSFNIFWLEISRALSKKSVNVAPKKSAKITIIIQIPEAADWCFLMFLFFLIVLVVSWFSSFSPVPSTHGCPKCTNAHGCPMFLVWFLWTEWLVIDPKTWKTLIRLRHSDSLLLELLLLESGSMKSVGAALLELSASMKSLVAEAWPSTWPLTAHHNRAPLLIASAKAQVFNTVVVVVVVVVSVKTFLKLSESFNEVVTCWLHEYMLSPSTRPGPGHRRPSHHAGLPSSCRHDQKSSAIT